LSPRSRKSDDDNDQTLIDFTTTTNLSQSSPAVSDKAFADDKEIPLVMPNCTRTQPFHGITFGKSPKQSQTTLPASDIAVCDDGEILLVGPNYTGTQASNGGTFREFPKQAQTTRPASDVAVADDGELLLIGPNFTGINPFLDGGKFGQFPSQIGIRSRTNLFLVDNPASSSGCDVSAANVVGVPAGGSRLSRDGYAAGDDLHAVGPDTGTGRAFTGGGISASFDESRDIGESTSPLLNVRCQDDTSEPSSRDAVCHVMCESSLDESASSTSPVAFVVSSRLRARQFVCD